MIYSCTSSRNYFFPVPIDSRFLYMKIHDVLFYGGFPLLLCSVGNFNAVKQIESRGKSSCFLQKLPPEVFLQISRNSQENTCVGVSFLITTQVFSCEFCEIFKNIFFTEHLPATASFSLLSTFNVSFFLFYRSVGPWQIPMNGVCFTKIVNDF